LVEKISDEIYLCDTMGFGFEKNIASYLVKGQDGSALFDVGYQKSLNSLLNELTQANVKTSDIRYIILSHTHLDHIGAASALLNLCPNASIVASSDDVRHLLDPSRLIEGTKMFLGEDIMNKIGSTDAIPEDKIIAVSENEKIKLGSDLEFTIINTPGHVPHHISASIENKGIILTGDAVCMYFQSFKVLFPPVSPPRFDLDLAISSINRLKSLAPKMLLTPHYGVIIPWEKYYEENIASFIAWKDEINQLLNEIGPSNINKAVAEKLLHQAGKISKDLPEYFESIYLTKLLNITVMGYLKYLKDKKSS